MLKKIVLYLLAALAGIGSAFALSAVFTVTAVMGSGMEGSADNGSHVLINRLAYGADGEEKPQVGDVVAFRSDVFGEEGEGSILVRRVAGSFGDVVEIKDNIFYLNGKPYEEHMYEAAAMEPLKKTRLGQYEIFVLSDNRRSGMDSRNEAVGIIDSRECIGRVCFQ